jgi:hypothetical protein
MTASTVSPEGMADNKDSALLAAVAEAVSWNHASQPDQPRPGQRVVIYPKHLTQMDEFLGTCETDDGQDQGHELAYNSILEAQAKYENTPIIVNESSEYVTTDPVLSQCVPNWMSLAEQIATGCRHRTLEDGRDVMNSDEEDDENMVPDKLTGMYTAEMLGPDGKPKVGLPKLSPAEASRQRAAAKAAKASKTSTAPQSVPASPQSLKPLPSCLADAEEEYPPDPPRSSSPYCPPGEDWSWMNEKQLRLAEAAAKAHQQGRIGFPRSSSTPGFDSPPKKSRADPTVQTPVRGDPLEITKVTAVPAVGISKQRTKAAATPQAPADQSETKGKKGQETEAQASTPMVTRSRKKASRAGGLRGVDGLGQTDERGHGGPSSKT